jgi:hypothetical protein
MPIFFKTPRPAVWESLSLRLVTNRRRSMPEPVDLDARYRLGGHGARTHRRLMAHCQLKPVHEPALTPTTASRGAGDRGSDVSSTRHPGPRQRRAGTRGPPRESCATSAPQRAVSTTGSQHHLVKGERAAKPRRITGSQGCPRPCGGVEQEGLGHGTQPAHPLRARHRHAHRTLPATHRPDRRRRLHDGADRVRRAHRGGQRARAGRGRRWRWPQRAARRGPAGRVRPVGPGGAGSTARIPIPRGPNGPHPHGTL